MDTGYSTLIMTVCNLNGHMLRQEQVTGREGAIRAWRSGEQARLTSGLLPGSFRVHVNVRTPTAAEAAEAIDSYDPSPAPRSLGAAAVGDAEPAEPDAATIARQTARLAAARSCVERIAALGLRGKRADDAALHYLTGYYSGLVSRDADAAQSLGAWIAYVVSTRGMIEVHMVAEGRQ